MSQSIKSISRLKVSKSISLGDNGDISEAGLTDTQQQKTIIVTPDSP